LRLRDDCEDLINYLEYSVNTGCDLLNDYSERVKKDEERNRVLTKHFSDLCDDIKNGTLP